MFHNRLRRFHVMVACFILSLTSIRGCARSVSCTPRYLVCFTRFTLFAVGEFWNLFGVAIDADKFTLAVVEC